MGNRPWAMGKDQERAFLSPIAHRLSPLLLHQRFDQRTVSRGKFVIRHLVRHHPANFLAVQCQGFPPTDRTAKEMQLDGLPRIFVPDHAKMNWRRHVNPQLLPKFTMQATFQRLPRFTLASREFPQAAEVRVRFAPCDQIAPFTKDEPGRDLNNCRHVTRDP